MSNKLKNIGEQLIPTIAYGDAAGLPFEGQAPIESDSVTGLQDTETNPYIGQYPAGTWSDDTHLSIAVAEGLIAADGFSLDSIAHAHMESLRYINGESDSPRWASPLLSANGQTGWGKGTTESVERLRDGVNPHESGSPNSAGNGVLMKMAPLVYWQHLREASRLVRQQTLIDITKMTHGAPEAIVSSLVHARTLDRLLTQSDPRGWSPSELYERALGDAYDYELSYDPEHKTSQILEKIKRQVERSTLSRQDILDASESNGFYAPDTLLMAYGSFVLQKTAPHSVYRAVELGGDADSVGSIVATMSLFDRGYFKMPKDADELYDLPRLKAISALLAHTALRTNS